jgi:hypothetical protein
MNNTQSKQRSRATQAGRARGSADAGSGPVRAATVPRGKRHELLGDDVELPRRRTAARAAQPPELGIHRRLNEDLQRLEQSALPGRSSLPMPEMLYAAGPVMRRYSMAPAPAFGGLPQMRMSWVVAVMAVALTILVWHWLATPPQTSISMWNGGLPTLSGSAPAQEQSALPQLDTPPGQHSLVGAPSITAAQIDAVLAKFGSPAAGTGELWVKLGKQYQIDPAYALAFFIHESSAGTNPNWAGLKPGGATTHNVGNIICAGYATCYGRFRDYPDWQTGIADWYRLIHDEYVQGRNLHTLEQIIPVYAPSVENNVPAYVQAVTNLINSWKQ